ncbi:MAG: hypothetical protein JW969_19945 [Spirochaetales bacterium]|nr:hypothetical protein [Spirochaetales bacterium]
MNSEKKGFLSPYHMGALAALNEIGNKISEENENIENILYVTAFQAGIERFMFLGPLDKENLTISPFFKERVSIINPKKDKDYYKLVHDMFIEYMPPDYNESEKYKKVQRLEFFMQDLMIGSDLKSSLITVLDIPNILELEGEIPASIFIPIRNLISSVKYETALLPVPKIVVPANDVERYQQILTSGAFARYSRAQEDLENTEKPFKVINEVVRTGKKLVEINFGLLSLRKTPLWILKTSPIIIETVFGKLPGGLAEVACKTWAAWIEQKRQFIIYNYYTFLTDIVIKQVKKFANIESEIEEAKSKSPYKIKPNLQHLDE